MKWPKSLVLVRHDVSEYNVLKAQKEADSLYQQFMLAFNMHPQSLETRQLAEEVAVKFALGVSDQATALVPEDKQRGLTVGQTLRKTHLLPDIIYLSPYARVIGTFERICQGWPELAGVPRIEDERLREQEHGLATLYNDWRVFHTLFPEQAKFYALQGRYWYRYPQGENIPDVRLRNNIWISTLIREFADKHVLAVTHHLNILATRANLERLSADEFVHLDENEKPINLGVTTYKGNPRVGRDGRLELVSYNQALW